MSLSAVAVIWSLLSIIVAASFWLSLLQPYWFVHSDSMTSLGVLSYCYHDNRTVAPAGGGRATDERCEVGCCGA